MTTSIAMAAEWQVLHNRFYRKQELYSLGWGNGVDLSRHKVACARFGGPVAIIRDDSKIVQLLAESARPYLQIFTASGMRLASVLWDRPGGRLIAMGWTALQTLLCVVQDGTIFQYNVHGELLDQQITMGKEAWEQGISECIIWGDGLVCLTETNQLFCIPDLNNPEVVKLAVPVDELEEPPLCMAVIEPQFTESGSLEVLLAVGTSVLLVDTDMVQELGSGLGPLQKMSVSPDGKYVACFTHDGRLLVTSSDFSRKISDFNTESALPPEQLIWCGLDSVLLYWEETLLMVGPYGNSIRYSYDEPLLLIPECDGVRILSNSSMEFLQRVPDSTVSIFKIGSTSPAAMLYDALDHFDRGSAKADENLRLIRTSLAEAVESCIDAASHEFNISRQRTLMRAAAYGRAFCSHFPRNRFREMCKTLRVLNAVGDPEIGIPLSIKQLEVLTAPVLIARLINAFRHLLALRISEYLGLSQETVLVHWACAKIAAAANVADTNLLDILVEKLKICPGISYAAVAAYAHKKGRRKLAALLLDYEPQSSQQVPLLTSMGEEERALVKAMESGDTDLVYFVIFHIWRQMPPADFFFMLQSKPLARDLFIVYARQNDPEALKNFYLKAGQPQAMHLNPRRLIQLYPCIKLLVAMDFFLFCGGLAEQLLRESWGPPQNPALRQGLPFQGPRATLIEQSQDLYAQTKEHTLESKFCEEQIKLLRVQHELEAATGQAIFVDSSVSDTIITCLVLGNNRAAQKIASDFKVHEKRFYRLKIKAFSTTKNWEGLEKFSKEKKPQIGFKPFVEACIEAGENSEALKYIVKLTDPQDRAEAYARIGLENEAREAAAQAKDSELLSRLKLSFGQNSSTGFFDSLRDKLSLQGSF